jgi:hypothetical protein
MMMFYPYGNQTLSRERRGISGSTGRMFASQEIVALKSESFCNAYSYEPISCQFMSRLTYENNSIKCNRKL